MTRDNNRIIRKVTKPNRTGPAQPVITRNTSSDGKKAGLAKTSVANQVAAIKTLPMDKSAVEKAGEAENFQVENKQLSDQLKKAQTDIQYYRSVLESSQQELKTTIDQCNLTEHYRLAAESELLDLKFEVKELRKKIAELEKKAQSETTVPVSAENVGNILTDFERSLSSTLAGFIVKDIELNLKTDILQKQDQATFVIPIKGTSATSRDTDGNITVRIIPERK